jgi:predicted PilT family ATPase
MRKRRQTQSILVTGGVTTSKVRIPSGLVPKLIGERGKTITQLCRDTKTRISVPKAEEGNTNVIVLIEGQPEDIKTAQYMMQKILKS